jgi:hypothetical protein
MTSGPSAGMNIRRKNALRLYLDVYKLPANEYLLRSQSYSQSKTARTPDGFFAQPVEKIRKPQTENDYAAR